MSASDDKAVPMLTPKQWGHVRDQWPYDDEPDMTLWALQEGRAIVSAVATRESVFQALEASFENGTFDAYAEEYYPLTAIIAALNELAPGLVTP